jgi:branched-chain amino acid transport system ATP-binding protein
MNALAVQNLSKSFGGFRALKSVSLSVGAGERRAIIGPNGAGKTTLFNVIGGQTRPTEGQICIDGDDVTGEPPHRMWERGLTRTFQRNQLFLGLSVLENVRLAAMRARDVGRRVFARIDRVPGLEEEVLSALAGVNLLDRRGAVVRNLAYGEQRQLEVALALVGRPKILLLDEPTAGMSPAETDAMIGMLATLPASITLLIVEHDMDVVFALASRVTVLHLGEVLADGSPREIQSDPQVISVYFGQHAGAAA